MAARIRAQMPMKTSIKTLDRGRGVEHPARFVHDAQVRARVDERLGDRPRRHRKPPSVFTTSPIQAAATSGSDHRKMRAMTGKIISSTTEKTTTSDDTMTGTMGRARIAAPVVIAADTPQMEIPEASGADHSRLNRKYLRAMK